MCIYIDNNVYREDLTDEEKETIYKYIYLITHMLAKKMKLFSNQQYYDSFSLWYTTQLFFRLQSPKQFELDENGEPKLKRIKSILNYIKNTIGARRVTFEQEEYSQVLVTQEDMNDPACADYSLCDQIYESLDRMYHVEFDLCLENCCKSIKQLVEKIPYKKDSTTWYNIYMSCLLSFLNSITISNYDLRRIANFKQVTDTTFIDYYEKEAVDPVILYHLPNDMHDYILVLLREIKHELAIELSQETHQYIGTNSGIYALMMSELNGYDPTDGDFD